MKIFAMILFFAVGILCFIGLSASGGTGLTTLGGIFIFLFGSGWIAAGVAMIVEIKKNGHRN